MAAPEIGILIIGGGCIGLSIARSLSRRGLGRSIMVIERHPKLGWETSSRSSEVIHASVYYPPNSLKAMLCRRGNEMMYEVCKANGIPHKRLGKLLVPQKPDEVRLLGRVLAIASASGGKGVRLVNADEIKTLEPNVKAEAAIYCPTSGIVDSHELMNYYEADFIENKGDIALNAEAVAIEKHKGIPAYSVHIAEVDLRGEEHKVVSKPSKVEARCIINCAGLGSARIAALAGIDVEKANYTLHPTKGTYFRVTKDLDKYPKMLVYPLPLEGIVGVHTTPDCYGGLRLGPYEKWLPTYRDAKRDFNHPGNRLYIGCKEIDMSVSEKQREAFVEAVRSFLPYVDPPALAPDTSGIHSKLQRDGESMRDWVIRHEHDRGLTNFFNLVGIESPGLTASPAIGEYVADLVQGQMK